MKIPTKKDETMHSIRYSELVSPNVDNPEEGCLLAAAVLMLAPYIKNFVLDIPGTIMVQPPYDIQLPPLRVYTFVQVTGRVLARTVGASDPIRAERSSESIESPESTGSAKKGKKVAGPGSSSGKVPPTMKNVDEEEEEEEDDDEEEDADAEEGDDDNNDDDDLAKLESIEEEMKSIKRPRRPKGSKGPKAKKAKTSQA